jgi:hypothetical protein
MSNLAPKVPCERPAESQPDLHEELERSDPKWILAGAIIFSENSLLTNERRFVSLFEGLKSDALSYPQSVESIIEGVEISSDDGWTVSPQIESMFFWLESGESGIHWPSLSDPETHANRYWFDNDSQLLYDFFERWGDDEKALKFFESCADHLAIKK